MLPSFALVLAGIVFGSTNSPSTVTISDCDLGDAYAFSTLDCQFAVSNNGGSARKVVNATAVTSRDQIEPSSIEISPYSTVYLNAKIRTGNSLARTRHRFDITTDEPGFETRTASARVFVLNALDQVKPVADFGVVTNPKNTPSRSVTLTTHEAASLRVDELLSKPEWCDVKIDNERAMVNVSIRPDAPWGIHEGAIKLKLNLPQQSEAWIEVRADVHGEVVPSINPIDLGLLRRGSSNSQLIKLTSASGKKFATGDAKLAGIEGSATFEKCQPASEGCVLVNLKVSDKQPLGAIRGRITIPVPQLAQSISMEATGMMLAADGVVDTLKPEASVGYQTSVGTHSTDLSSALKQATTVDHDEPPPGTGPLLRWSISNGDLVHGFQIFRSTSGENGSYTLLNKEVLRSKDNGKPTTNYQYRDNSAESGKEYWYYISIVYEDGRKQALTQPQRAIAK